MLFDGDGQAMDWITGYAPPVESYKELVDKSLRGEDTVKNLKRKLAEDPNSVDSTFKLGMKYDDFGDQARANELFRKVLALDPDGKKGETDFVAGRGRVAEKVTYTQYAEFNIGAAALSSRPPDPSLLQAFVKKHRDGEIVKSAFSQLSRAVFLRTAPKAEAAAFYEDYVGRYPQDVPALSAWVQRILQDKEPADKGIALAQRALELSKAEVRPGATPAGGMGGGPTLALNLARLYALNGDKAKALETIDAAWKSGGSDDRILPSIAQAYVDIGAEDKALAAYGPAFLNRNLTAAAALRSYAAFWTNQNANLQSALEAAKKGTELASEDYRSWITLGNIYLKLKNPAEAVKAADKAVQIAPAGFQEVAKRMADQVKKQAAEIK